MSEVLVQPKRRWYFSLWFLVLIFMLAGIMFGLIDPTLAKQSKPLIDNFIYVIKLLVGPIIFFTVISGIIGMGSLKQLGGIGIKAFLYFEVISTFALVIGLSFGHIFHPGIGLNLSVTNMDPSLISKYTSHEENVTSFAQILLSAVPHNIWDPFLSGDTLQILFIAICCGFVLFYLALPWAATASAAFRTVSSSAR